MVCAEYWIPAEDLDRLNEAIAPTIEVVRAFPPKDAEG
jgi:hypothetical protein